MHRSAYDVQARETHSTALSPIFSQWPWDELGLNMNWKTLKTEFQVFKMFTYCESLLLHKLGSWSPPSAPDVKCSHVCRRPLAGSRAALGSAGPVGNTCFLYRALTWAFSLKCTHTQRNTQTLKGKLQVKRYIQKQNQKPQPANIILRHWKDSSPAQTLKTRKSLM